MADSTKNLYTKGVSDWDPKGDPKGVTYESKLGTVARENQDEVSSSNELKQYMGSGKAAGRFGVLGKKGIGEF